MLALLTATSAIAEKVRLAVTSSFHNSGLSDHIIPHIETDLEIDIQLIVVGLSLIHISSPRDRTRSRMPSSA